jgi:hypothetical protein
VKQLGPRCKEEVAASPRNTFDHPEDRGPPLLREHVSHWTTVRTDTYTSLSVHSLLGLVVVDAYVSIWDWCSASKAH